VQLSVVGFDGTPESVNALARAHQLGGPVHVVAALELAAGGGVLPGVSVTQVTWEREVTPDAVAAAARRVGATVVVLPGSQAARTDVPRLGAGRAVLVTSTRGTAGTLPTAYRGILVDVSGPEPSGAAAAIGARIAGECRSRLVLARAEDRRHPDLRRFLDELIAAGEHIDLAAFRTPRPHDQALNQVRSLVAASGAPAEFVHGTGSVDEVLRDVAAEAEFDLWVSSGDAGSFRVPDPGCDRLHVFDGAEPAPADYVADPAATSPLQTALWVAAADSPIGADCRRFERCRDVISAADVTVAQGKALLEHLRRATERTAAAEQTRRGDLANRCSELQRERAVLAAWLAEPVGVGAVTEKVDAAEAHVAKTRDVLVGLLDEMAARVAGQPGRRSALEAAVKACSAGALADGPGVVAAGEPERLMSELAGLAASVPGPDGWFMVYAHLQRASLVAEATPRGSGRDRVMEAARAARAKLLDRPRRDVMADLAQVGRRPPLGTSVGADDNGAALAAVAIERLRSVTGLAALVSALHFADNVLSRLTYRFQLVG